MVEIFNTTKWKRFAVIGIFYLLENTCNVVDFFFSIVN